MNFKIEIDEAQDPFVAKIIAEEYVQINEEELDHEGTKKSQKNFDEEKEVNF